VSVQAPILRAAYAAVKRYEFAARETATATR
jgi:surfactin synthase thioesterase subunit